MGLKNNAAYAGSATMEDGARVRVLYLDRQEVFRRFGHQAPGHPNRRKIGWYWKLDDTPEVAEVLHGHFSSSRIAMQDAMRKHAKSAAA